MIYTAPFDMSVVAAGTVAFAQTAAPTETATITLATIASLDGNGTSSTIFSHYAAGSYGSYYYAEDPLHARRHKTIAVDSLPNALASAVNALWGAPTFTCTWSSTTGKYTFAGSQSFTITWSAAALAVGAQYIFGFVGNRTTATSHTGEYVAKYAIVPDLTATSVSGSATALNYEPQGIGNHPIADDGTGYGLTRVVSPLYRDWVQQFEVEARCMRLSNGLSGGNTVVSYTPTYGYWTFQELFEYCRGIWPFIVIDGFGESYNEIFSFRTDGMSWALEPAAPGDKTHFHVQFRTIVDAEIVPNNSPPG